MADEEGGVRLTIRPGPRGVRLVIAPAAPSAPADADADERASHRVWGKVDALLRSYRLSALGMVIARKWLRRIADPSLAQFDRLRPWVLGIVNGRPRARPQSPWQAGCPELLPELRATPVWPRDALPWLDAFEAQAEAICAELLALRGQRGFQPLRVPHWASRHALDSADGHGQLSHDAGDWNVFYLHLHEVRGARAALIGGTAGVTGRRYPSHAAWGLLGFGPHWCTGAGAELARGGRRGGEGRVARGARARAPRAALAARCACATWSTSPPPACAAACPPLSSCASHHARARSCARSSARSCPLSPPLLPCARREQVSFARNRALCPVTCALLEAVPRAYEHAFFSALSPGTHIIKHNGPTNKKLRIHLPLAGVRGSRLRVGGDVHEAVRGRALVFDDSFEHEAWHDGPETRLVLVFDVWHPDFSDDEVRFLNFLQKNKMRAEMAADEAQPHEESFYKLLADANQLLDGTDWWVQAADGAGDVAGDAVGGAGGAVGGAAGGAVGGGAGEGTEAAVAP
jgi:hypothetical protein